MTKYLSLSGYSPRIDKIEVDSETDACVVIAGRRHRKKSSYDSYHDTFQAAKDKLLRDVSHNLRVAEAQFQRAQSAFDHINSLTEIQ